MRELRELGGGSGGRYSAVPTSDDGGECSSFSLKIKTLDDTLSWDANVEGSWTVHQLKQHLKDKYSLQGNRIRLIHTGRMLEDSHTVSSYGLKEGDFVHAAISDEPPPEHRIDIPSARAGATRGAQGADEDEGSDASGGASGRERGFDRLVHTGFTPHEIHFLRAQFHARRGVDASRRTREEMVEFEEEWFENQQEPPDGGRTDRRFSRIEVAEGTQADFIIGMVMGFIFGVIMVFWIWDRGVSKRQKLGILCGVGFNFTMGMLRIQSRSQGLRQSNQQDRMAWSTPSSGLRQWNRQGGEAESGWAGVKDKDSLSHVKLIRSKGKEGLFGIKGTKYSGDRKLKRDKGGGVDDKGLEGLEEPEGEDRGTERARVKGGGKMSPAEPEDSEVAGGGPERVRYQVIEQGEQGG